MNFYFYLQKAKESHQIFKWQNNDNLIDFDKFYEDIEKF